ncbi:MAG TPA: tetratricopeptide repeat protein [Vulgatibacter sp.]|nr:tetratricopeptide repeat protein [Vulgatibacter sp.]
MRAARRAGAEGDAEDLPTFVGRRAARAEVAALLAEHRLVALLGPSGIGKTRLAAEVGRPPFWRGRAIRIDGSSRALGASLDRAERELNGRRPALVILDGLERAAPEVARRLAAWLDAAPSLRILATATRRPGLPGERCWEVPPLSVEDGVALLRERASRLGADAWIRAEGRVLEEVVARLDGSPLALELAAGRARALSPRRLLQRLDDGLDLLRRPGDDRHASVEASVAWMWSRLPPGERMHLARASVFEGGFDLDAWEWVSAPSEGGRRPIEVLGDLRDASTVREDGERLRIPETVRWFAARELARQGEDASVDARRRHAAWCLGLFSELPGDDESLPRVIAERANLLAAHRFGLDHDPAIAARAALGLGRALAVLGPAAEEEAILDAGVEAARRAGDPLLLARLVRDRAMFEIRTGRLTEARLDLDEFETIARDLGDRLLEIQAGIEQGRLRFAAADFDTAQVLLVRGLDRLGEGEAGGEGDGVVLFLQGYTHNLLGMVREAQGRLDEGARCFETALGIFRRVGNRRYRALALMNLGVVRYAAGELERALSIFEQAIEASRAAGNRAGEADGIVNLGSVLLHLGNLGEAERQLRRGLDLEREAGNRRAVALTLGNLGVAAFERGELRFAEELLRTAVDTARVSGERNFHALYLAWHGAVSSLLGERASAPSEIRTARSWFESTGDVGHLATVGVLEAFLHLSSDEEREARVRAALSLLEAGGSSSRSAGARLAMRLLRRAIVQRGGAGQGAARGRRRRGAVLEVGPEVSWLRYRGAYVDLGRRRAPRRIARALVERRLAAPGIGVSAERLAAEGWPGGGLPPEVLSNRVYVAVNTLRAMGLRDAILRRDDGYLLDPALVIEHHD